MEQGNRQKEMEDYSIVQKKHKYLGRIYAEEKNVEEVKRFRYRRKWQTKNIEEVTFEKHNENTRTAVRTCSKTQRIAKGPFQKQNKKKTRGVGWLLLDYTSQIQITQNKMN